MSFKKNIIPVLFLASLCLAFTSPESKTISQNMEYLKNKNTSPEAYFLEAYTSHQIETLKMAQLALRRAKSSELKILVQKMVNDQNKDLALLNKWSVQYSSTMQSQEEPPDMKDLAILESASEDRFDKLFTSVMAQHQKDGISIAKNIEPLIENKKIKDFAEKAVSKQSMEIGYLDELKERM